MFKHTSISLGEVRDTSMIASTGTFLVKVFCLGEDEIFVHYVSPYASNTQGGFLAIPEVGTQILVCKPEGINSWFYLGATFLKEPRFTEDEIFKEGLLTPIQRIDEDIDLARGIPEKIVLKSTTGAKLEITNQYNPGFHNQKIRLKSSTGKQVSLVDSPAIDSIIIDSNNGSRILVTNEPQNNSVPARAVLVDTQGPQVYTNRGSQTDIVVAQDGRELQLINNANGSTWGAGIDCGSINLQSKWKDVNIFTKASEGKIFIKCLDSAGNNQIIQIETAGQNGVIVIKSSGDIRLISEGSVDVTSSESVNILSPVVNIAGGTVNIAADNLNITSPVNNMIGNLGNPIITPAGAEIANPNSSSFSNKYSNGGVNTY